VRTLTEAAPLLVQEDVRPPWSFRLGPPSMDGLLRRRAGGLVRLVHIGDEPVVVAVAQRAPQRVTFAARAFTEAGARAGIARLRFATGVDDDLAEFHAGFRGDPVLGRTLRGRPDLRVRRHAYPWETLAWAITEQLIDFERATAIQRRLIGALGRRCATTGLRDSPAAAVIAAQAPARLEACGLAAKRALAMRRAAAEVAAGRVEWGDPRRLLAIPEIGTWTAEMVALHGLGRLDVVPAGDLGYLKLVGRLATGHPRAVADEAEVRGFFARYAPWAGLAGEYLRLAAATGRLSSHYRPDPRPAGTRWSAAAGPRAAA
jgi:DNA-3-methyladenine glycosylase II